MAHETVAGAWVRGSRLGSYDALTGDQKVDDSDGSSCTNGAGEMVREHAAGAAAHVVANSAIRMGHNALCGSGFGRCMEEPNFVFEAARDGNT